MFFKCFKNKFAKALCDKEMLEISKQHLGSLLHFILAVCKHHGQFGWKGHLQSTSTNIESSLFGEGER